MYSGGRECILYEYLFGPSPLRFPKLFPEFQLSAFQESAHLIHGASPGLGKNEEGPLPIDPEGPQGRTRAT